MGKANRGAGSICNMVTMLVKGFAAGFPDSSKAPKAKTIYGKQKWAAPSGGWKFDGDAMLLQKGEAAKEAKAKKAAKASAAIEAKWTKKEADATKVARKLNKDERKLDKAAAKASAKANLDLTKDEASAAKKEAAADASTAKAEKKAAAFAAKIKAELATIKKATGAAKKASEKRLAAYKKTMAKLTAGIAAAKKLAADHAKINSDYDADKKELAADNAKNEKKLDDEEKKYADEEAATDKKNKASAAADQAAIKADEKKNKATDKKEKGALAATAAKEAASKKKTEAAYQKKKEAAAKVLKAKRGKEAAKKAAIAAKADAVYHKAAKEAAMKQEKANKAAAKEKASKAASKKKLAQEEKTSKVPAAEIPTCGPGDCLKGAKCHKTTAKGPFMCADLVTCCKVAPAVAPFSGMSWAHIPPPPPPPPVVPSAACVANRKKCKADKACAPLMKLDSIKATKAAGCQKSKGLLDLWFALTSTCPNAKYPGFQSNIPMWKEQITDMPVYKDTGTTGRFKANRGAGSICNMVTQLVDGFAAGFPDSSSAPVAKTIYGKQKWTAPSGGWKFTETSESH